MIRINIRTCTCRIQTCMYHVYVRNLVIYDKEGMFLSSRTVGVSTTALSKGAPLSKTNSAKQKSRTSMQEPSKIP